MIKQINTEQDYSSALELAEYYFSNPSQKGTEDGNQFELL